MVRDGLIAAIDLEDRVWYLVMPMRIAPAGWYPQRPGHHRWDITVLEHHPAARIAVASAVQRAIPPHRTKALHSLDPWPI